MKRILAISLAVACSLTAAFAQPGGREEGQNVPGAGRRWVPEPDPEYIIYSSRANMPFGAGATNFDGRSHNNSPTFFIYPDGKRGLCVGHGTDKCEQCGFCMSGEMASVFSFRPDTIFAGLKLRV
jgi:hypothetical protein